MTRTVPRRWLCIAIAASIAALGCREPRRDRPETEDGAAVTDAEPAADSDLTRRLAALGYLDYVSEPTVAPRLGVTVWERGLADDGYSLYVVRRACKAVLIAMDGTVVRTWQSESTTCYGWDNAELLPNGGLVVPEIALGLRRYDFDGRLRRVIRLPAHHDVTTNGPRHLVTLTRTFRLIPDVHPTIRTADDEITMLSGIGTQRERVSLWDLLSANPLVGDLLDVRPHGPLDRAGASFVDLFHANSVEWMRRPDLAARDPLYDLDNVLVSIRNQNLVVMVHWPSRTIRWAWGRGELSRQHDASMLATGHVLIFDNGVRRRRSRVVEVDPLRSEIVWQYDGGSDRRFFSRGMGSAQRLPNGNTLLAVSNSAYFLEVTPDGRVVWEYHSPDVIDGRRATVVRVTRYPKSLVEPLLARTRSKGRASPGTAAPSRTPPARAR